MQRVAAFVAAGLLASASAYGSISSGAARPSYGASYAALSDTTARGGNQFARLNASLHAGLLKHSGSKANGFPSNYDQKLGTSTFLWAPASVNPKAAVTARPIRPQ